MFPERSRFESPPLLVTFPGSYPARQPWYALPWACCCWWSRWPPLDRLWMTGGYPHAGNLHIWNLADEIVHDTSDSVQKNLIMKIGDEVSWWSALQHVATLRPNPVPTFCHPGIPARYAPRGNGPREPFSSAPLGGPKWTWAGQKEKVIHKKRRCQALTRGANSSIHICICIYYIYILYI